MGGRLARLNHVAAAAWEAIDRVKERDALHREMRRRYGGVHDATLRRDIDSLLDRWLEDGWIARIEDPLFPSPGEEWQPTDSTHS